MEKQRPDQHIIFRDKRFWIAVSLTGSLAGAAGIILLKKRFEDARAKGIHHDAIEPEIKGDFIDFDWPGDRDL